MGQEAPYKSLEKLPPQSDKIETFKIFRKTNKTTAALAELNGVANTIPNQSIMVNAIVLQEALGSSKIENIITTQDELYKALTIKKIHISPETKEVINYRKATFHGYNLIKRHGFLHVNDIINIQNELIGNNAGIKSTPSTILKNDTTREVVYTPLNHFLTKAREA